MKERKPAVKTVADCVRARYRCEDWFVSVAVENGEVRLLVRDDCPFREHRPVLNTAVRMRVKEPPPPLPAEPPGATPAAPAARREKATSSVARENVLAMRKARLDRHILSAAAEVRGRMLGPSSEVCGALIVVLRCRHGIVTKPVELAFGFATHHVLELPDGRIVDPTADQFAPLGADLPPVYLGPMPEVYARWSGDKAEATG